MSRKKVLITGSGGLIGSEAVGFFVQKDFEVVGVDNDMRSYYFGKEGSTKSNVDRLIKQFKNYQHESFDIREAEKLEEIFKNNKFDLIIHTAAQPSHDWAAKEPITDFSVNAGATLLLLENLRKYSPDAVFIFTSTNKVYGDYPNTLPLIEKEDRWEISPRHKYANGISEDMPIDQSTHSLFGVSKAAADLMVQEYGRYFNLKTVVFRGGCLTGSKHAGVQQHGFLSYLVKCIATGRKYSIFGYKGKQVRDNIHSYDLINAFYEVFKNPRFGEVYNMGGSRFANVSITEAIKKVEDLTGRKANISYVDKNRIGDHIWYISSVDKFKSHYPNWQYKYDIDATIEDICRNSSFAKKVFAFTMNKNLDYWKEKNWYFHNSLRLIFKEIVGEGKKVLQVGYGLGDILSGLFPKVAVSIDTDSEILESSRSRYPYIKFIDMDPININLRQKFDYVILPNSVDHIYDVQGVLEKLKNNIDKRSRVIMTSVNPRWEQLLYFLEKINLKRPEGPKNWLRIEALKNLAEVSGYKVESSGFRLLMPTHIPLLSSWLNKVASKSKLLSRFCLEQFIVITKENIQTSKNFTTSIIIPCFNEEESIKRCIESIPRIGKKTEIIVVDDGSIDKTTKIVRSMMNKYKNLKLITYKPNHGKGYAVREGMNAATGDILMIFDADMAVPAEELTRFYNVLASRNGRFVNGTRVIYPMEDQAMRQANLIGNLMVGSLFSWLLGQRITDTLCGTKALFKKDYKKIKMSGEGWGDFDLLFGAAENNLKIVEMPVHYKKRFAGESKMTLKSIAKHSLLLARMCLIGLWRLKIKPILSNRSKLTTNYSLTK